jgi:hypothetical protein
MTLVAQFFTWVVAMRLDRRNIHIAIDNNHKDVGYYSLQQRSTFIKIR